MGDKKKSNKLDSKSPDDIKEKTYLTRHVDTSISILDSPENDIVLEALLFLSKYADIRLVNLTYLQQKGLLIKLLNLFNRNMCILRLSLRLLTILLNIDDVMIEFNQGIYDDQIKQITDFYIHHDDIYVREFAVNILIKLSTTCRITCLIFSVDLLNPILETLQKAKSKPLLRTTLQLLDVLLGAPPALSVLPELQNFDVTVIINYLDDIEEDIVKLAFNIVLKLTGFGLDVYQNFFRHHHLVERMLDEVMIPENKQNHEIALKIINNCMNSEITHSYFVESIEFLRFCSWVKTCDPEYLDPCIDIYLKLSSMPEIRQMLFDLSVEESILYFLRSNDKIILNKTCVAISNMSEHQYCCEQMLTPGVVKELCDILEREDKEDPENEVAIKTISILMKRSLKTIDLLNRFLAQHTFIDMFRKGMNVFDEEIYLLIIVILYQFAVHPIHQETIVDGKFFGELLRVVQTGTDNVAILCLEMLTYFVPNTDFIDIFLTLKGPHIIIEKLKTTKNPRLLKTILVFIHCTLLNDAVTKEFIKQKLVKTLKEFPDSVKRKAPLMDTILNLTYNVYLPLKFFEMNRIEIPDKLINKFYIITGKWTGQFPFLEIFTAEKVSPILTIYIVDYTYQVYISKKTFDTETQTTEGKRKSVEIKSPVHTVQNPYEINYGGISADPFLPTYIHHIKKYFETETSIVDKIKFLAVYVDTILCGPNECLDLPQKFHTFQLHIQSLKYKLGTNMIPIGYLRIGFHCEKALLFKAIADVTCIPCSLVKGENNLYWNEVAILKEEGDNQNLFIYIVDLMKNIGNLMCNGSREANEYCNTTAFKRKYCNLLNL